MWRVRAAHHQRGGAYAGRRQLRVRRVRRQDDRQARSRGRGDDVKPLRLGDVRRMCDEDDEVEDG